MWNYQSSDFNPIRSTVTKLQDAYKGTDTQFMDSIPSPISGSARLMVLPLVVKGYQFRLSLRAGTLSEFTSAVRRLRDYRSKDASACCNVQYFILSSDITSAFQEIPNLIESLQLGENCRTIEANLMETARHKLRVFLNKETNTLTVLDSRKEGYPTRLSSVLAALPLVFGINLAELGIPTELFSLWAQPNDENLAKYIELAGKYFKDLPELKSLKQKQIENMLKARAEQRLQSLVDEKVNAERRVDAFFEEYKQACERAYNAAMTLEGAKTQVDSDPALEAMLASMPYLFRITGDKTSISLDFATPMSDQDEMYIKGMEQNPDSWLNGRVQRVSNEHKLNAIVLRRVIARVLRRQGYTLYFAGGISAARSAVTKRTFTPEFGMLNPHIYSFDCWSQVHNKIRDASNKSNEALIISYSIAAIADLNIADGAVCGEFVGKIAAAIAGLPNYADGKCVLSDEGEELTWKEVYELEKHLFDRESETIVAAEAE